MNTPSSPSPGAQEEQLFQKNVVVHGPAILGYFMRRIARREDAADLVAEVLLAAWRRVRDIPSDPDEAKRWLFSLSRGALANYRRGEARRLQLADALRWNLRDSQPTWSDNPGIQALEALTEVDRELLTLVYWEGFTLREAADILGIRAPTARKRAERARRQLAGQLRSPARSDPTIARGPAVGGARH